MPAAIPHPSHRSADSRCAGGIDQCRPHRVRSTLSVAVRKPFRGAFRTSVTSNSRLSVGSLVVDPARLSQVEVGPSGWAGLSNVVRKGCLRISTHERDRTGTFPQPTPTRCLFERVCGDRLRLAAPPLRPTRIPRRQARPLSTVGRRPLDRQPDRNDFTRQSMREPYGGGTV